MDALRECRTCPHVVPPSVIGAVPGARVYLMGQAPGPREAAAGRPFAWTAGRTLFKWFASVGVEEALFRERVHMAAVISCFPGKLPGKQGDRKPSKEEIESCGAYRKTELKLMTPDLVIPVGRMAIEWFMDCPSLDAVIGKTFTLDLNGRKVDAVPLPHPSGLSRWIQQPAGKQKIAEALDLIVNHAAWKQTFAGDIP